MIRSSNLIKFSNLRNGSLSGSAIFLNIGCCLNHGRHIVSSLSETVNALFRNVTRETYRQNKTTNACENATRSPGDSRDYDHDDESDKWQRFYHCQLTDVIGILCSNWFPILCPSWHDTMKQYICIFCSCNHQLFDQVAGLFTINSTRTHVFFIDTYKTSAHIPRFSWLLLHNRIK